MAGKWLVDFDGTLVKYGKWVSCEHIGEPIQPMIDRVKMWLKQGREVQIFTARAEEGDTFDKGYSAGFTSGYAEALDKYGIKQ